MRSGWLRLARLPIIRSLVSWLFTHMSTLLPLNPLYESERVIAFNHPAPDYPIHVLIVPKATLADVEALRPENADLLVDLLLAVQTLIKTLALKETGYRLIVNGGPYQEIPHLHFHLVSGSLTV